jgi:YfiH family protein
VHTVRKQGLVFYQFMNLADERRLIHFVTTRHGGASPPPYDSLNLAMHVGDAEDLVLENRRRALAASGLSPERLVSGEQTHGGNLVFVEDAVESGEAGTRAPIPNCDGLLTRRKGLILSVYSADCPLVLLYGPGGALAVLHAGWRCILGRICARAARFMVERLGCKAQAVKAGISPSIGPLSYVVREDFVEAFSREGIHADCITRRKGRIYFDLWKAAFDQLASAGLRPENVEISGVDSASRPDEFFSARREGTTGRFALMACLV